MKRLLNIIEIYASFIFIFFDLMLGYVGISSMAKPIDLDLFVRNNNLNKDTSAETVASVINRSFVLNANDSNSLYAKHPLSLLTDKFGSCADFALFCECILIKAGFEDVYKLHVKNSIGKSNIVCIAKFSDGFYWQVSYWPEFQLSSANMIDQAKIIALKLGGQPIFCAKVIGYYVTDYA